MDFFSSFSRPYVQLWISFDSKFRKILNSGWITNSLTRMFIISYIWIYLVYRHPSSNNITSIQNVTLLDSNHERSSYNRFFPCAITLLVSHYFYKCILPTYLHVYFSIYVCIKAKLVSFLSDFISIEFHDALSLLLS